MTTNPEQSATTKNATNDDHHPSNGGTRNTISSNNNSNNSEIIMTSFTCSVCQQNLKRDRFSKKTIKKGIYICTNCRKTMTASRMKQPMPIKNNNSNHHHHQQQQQQNQGGNNNGNRRSESGIQRRPNNWGYCDYVDRVFSLSCFTDLVRLKVFTSAKDVSESMAAIQAAVYHHPNNIIINKNKSNKNKTTNTICLCVGDGSTPRTAVLACYLQNNKWDTVVSIDPALKDEWVGISPKGVQKLIGFQGMLQEFMASSSPLSSSSSSSSSYCCSHLILLLVHSHARFIGSCSIDNVRTKFGTTPEQPPTTTLVSLPCCTRFRHTQDLHHPPTIQYDDECVFSACRTVQIWIYNDNDNNENNDDADDGPKGGGEGDISEARFCQPITK